MHLGLHQTDLPSRPRHTNIFCTLHTCDQVKDGYSFILLKLSAVKHIAHRAQLFELKNAQWNAFTSCISCQTFK